MNPRNAVNTLYLSILLVVALLCGSSLAADKAEFQISLTVVDEEGVPVENAHIGTTYIPRMNSWESSSLSLSGSTDSNGKITVSATGADTVWIGATKDGFYQSGGKYKYQEIRNGRWEPWNPEIRIVMRKVLRPVAMYARYTKFSKLVLPDVNKKIGFDLAAFDWIVPFGAGIHSDMVFILEGQYSNENKYDMTLTLTFSNDSDGIQAVKDSSPFDSKFKLARFAPLMGYQKNLVKYRKRKSLQAIGDNFDSSINYYFRIRSELRDRKLLRAMYGKILGDIQFYPASANTAKIVFKYYLNPDYTQNLEYDPMQNLFIGLRDRRSLEWVDIE